MPFTVHDRFLEPQEITLMPDCPHAGFHSGQGRYNRDAEALRYVIVCDDCQQELGEVGSEPYRPQFDPGGNDPYLRQIGPLAITEALKGGVATLGALGARTGAERSELLWAVEEALDQGWVSASGPGCGAEGICGASAPTVYAITERGRAAVDAARR